MCSFPVDTERRYASVRLREEPSRFDVLLQQKWKEAETSGVLRYVLPDLRTKKLPGPIGFVAQLNLKRGIERRAPAHITSLYQKFDKGLFNFTKVKPDEVLFEVVEGKESKASMDVNRHYVIANVSPLEFCNILLVPRLGSCQPQVISLDSLIVSMKLILASSQWAFRIGFNSLCAFASVNHLHYHGYYVNHELPCEKWPVAHFVGPCYELKSYPGRGFVFFLDDSIESLARSVFALVDLLHRDNIAHNLMMTRGLDSLASVDADHLVLRIIVWPRKSSLGAKQPMACNVAVCELAGHLPIYNEDDYVTMTDTHASQMLKDTALADDEYEFLKKRIKVIFKN